MSTLTFRNGKSAARGGLDITISLSPEEATAAGMEATVIADWMDTYFWALAMLRTGTNTRTEEQRPDVAGDWYTVLNDLEHRLTPRLQGVVDAAIRRHHAQSGTLGELALSMDCAKSTAQSRRDAVLKGRNRPSIWENWATGSPRGAQVCEACGHLESEGDPLVITTEDGARIHRSHTIDPESGFYGAAFNH